MRMSRSGPSINIECDGCGHFVEVELPDFPIDIARVIAALLEKLGWLVCERGDFCPECSGVERCEDCGEQVDYVEHCMGCSMKVCAECGKEHDERDCSTDVMADDEPLEDEEDDDDEQ